MLEEYVNGEIVSQFAWSLIVIDGTKAFGDDALTWKVASEEQDDEHWRCC